MALPPNSTLQIGFDYNVESIVTKLNIRKDNVKRTLKRFGFEQDKDYIILKYENQIAYNKETIMLKKSAHDQVITHYAFTTRKTSIDSDIELKFIKRYLPEETETLDFVYETFSPSFTLKKQYKILSYRVDLYILGKKLAIECDEHNHNDRDPKYEKKREIDIIEATGCKFIRFNPNDKTFKLSTLVASIVKACLVQVES